MLDSLEELVHQTRRSCRPRAGSHWDESSKRRRQGELSLPNAAAVGALPEPRLAESEPLAEPPEQTDLFQDFAVFGERIANLMEEAQDRRTRRRRCSPFVSGSDGQVILKPRRSRARRASNNIQQPPSPDAAAGKLVAVGLAILALLAVATVILSSPAKKPASKALAKQPIEAPAASELDTPTAQPRTEFASGPAAEPGD